ncbi:hypothetical protein CFR76_16655 [Komagataeibacter swingsii]|uniref:Uncharacterized protein n=2 Tax=Komagataeibacter swingsii TaxID=215220 RepID=A0A2V4R077_9PROT|nr:hypothetical protein CFR76_16655 [Komagataeibacter swingsii]GBQ58421.1 hypothetical protein AA16373_1262 [Komagataeibacter swingsii DSM 16373]
MTDRNRTPETGPLSPVNDNERTNEIKPDMLNPVMKARMDELVFVLARMLGRQIAANDNASRAGTDINQGEPDG